MNPSSHSRPSDRSDTNDFSESFIEDFVSTLQDGGPEVSPEILLAFIEKELPSQKMSAVKALINTWKAWHDMYVVLFHGSLDEEIDEHPAIETPVPDTIRKTIRSLIERQGEE